MCMHLGTGVTTACRCGRGKAGLNARMGESWGFFFVLKYHSGPGAVGCVGDSAVGGSWEEVSRWHLHRWPVQVGCPGPAQCSAGVCSCHSNTNSCYFLALIRRVD